MTTADQHFEILLAVFISGMSLVGWVGRQTLLKIERLQVSRAEAEAGRWEERWESVRRHDSANRDAISQLANKVADNAREATNRITETQDRLAAALEAVALRQTRTETTLALALGQRGIAEPPAIN